MHIPVVDPRQPMSYSPQWIPVSYSCGECRKVGVKLWRRRNTVLSCQILRCVTCAGKMERTDTSGVDPVSGVYEDAEGIRSDGIGGLVPAIPTPANDNFFGANEQKPGAAILWWRQLPLR